MSTTNSQIKSLTGLRFFAAAMVVANHFSNPTHRLIANFTQHSFIGVTIFFVLSGFILSYSYASRPGSMRGTLRSFWMARIARLYPVYLVGIALFVPVVFYATGETAFQRISTGLLSLIVGQAWIRPLGMPFGMWNPPGWSLSAEEFFYLVFPFICKPLSKLSMRQLLGFSLMCWLLSLTGTLKYLATDYADRDLWMFFPLLRLPEFLLGMSAGIVWKNRKTSAFDAIAPYTAALSAIALIAFLSCSLREEMFLNGVTAPFAVLLICSLASNRGLLARFLSCKPLVALGGASYSLYILHWIIWLMALHVFGRSQIMHTQPNLFFIAYFIVATISAYICFRFIEEPMNRFLRVYLMERNSMTSATATPTAKRKRPSSPAATASHGYGNEITTSSGHMVLKQDDF